MQLSWGNQPQFTNPRCQLLQCYNQIMDPRLGNYCRAHTCRVKDCGQVIRQGGTLCQAHRCRGACQNPAVQLNGWCESHLKMKCKHGGGCDQPREDAGQGNFCAEHTCRRPGCWGGRTERRSGLSQFCANHTCNSPADCSNEKSSRLTYCIDHECATPLCSAPKIDGTQCCSRHRCQLLFSAQTRCDGVIMSTQTKYRFCEQHTCHVQECSNGCGLDAFCSGHTCQFLMGGDCKQLAAYPSRWCMAHGSIVSQL